MKKIIAMAFGALLIVSCSDNLDGLNEDTKNPSFVAGESLFTAAQKSLVDQVVDLNVNNNNTKLWMQYLQESTYTDESNYDQVTRTIPEQQWSIGYREVLRDLKESNRVISETTYSDDEAMKTNNKLMIIEILTVYAYAMQVEIFGNVPYTEAVNIDILTPKYDDGETVYRDLINRLNTAINGLDSNNGSFGASDNIYGGDVALWLRFANSLKLRMGLLMADIDNSLAQTTAEAAATGVLMSNADNANFTYLSSQPNTNPVHTNVVLSGRNDFVAGKTIIDFMNATEDPRRPLWFTTVNGAYVGGEIGSPSTYSAHSHLSEQVVAATAPGVIMDYAEVQFLLAEAAARGYNTGDTPANHHAAGITASIENWGGTADEIATFLARPDVDYATVIANSTAVTPWKEAIGNQKWVALFNRGLESWISKRMLDYPLLAVPTEAVSGFPNRYTYPIVEQTLNATNYNEASTAIGGDAPETKLFWDKN